MLSSPEAGARHDDAIPPRAGSNFHPITAMIQSADPLPRKRILLVDDHSVVRDGIALWLGATPDLEVCGAVTQTQAALEAVEALRPDLVITDIGMPGRDGLELTKDIRARWPELPVLIFSVHDEALYAGRALRAGARGYCSKGAGSERLVEAVRAVLRGGMAFSPETTTRLLEQAGGGKAGGHPLTGLSDREFEVFRLFGAGQTNAEVAANLGLSTKTVETHSLNIRRKLGLRTPAELIRHAVHLSSVEHAGTTAAADAAGADDARGPI
jgi:DNA-binding NarL/FixJ family response regulator